MPDTAKENIQDIIYLPAIVYEFYPHPQEETETVNPRPENGERETMKPEATKPEATKPEMTKPETTKPEKTKPETTKPETTKPKATKPKATESVTASARRGFGKFMAAAFRKAGRFMAAVFRKAGRFMAVVFRRLGVIYCRNICTYSNMILIGAAFLLCITGAFSQAAFGILVLLNLMISVCADRKERKRLERILWSQDVREEAEGVTPTEKIRAAEGDESPEVKAAVEGKAGAEDREATETPGEIVIRQRKSKLERSLDAYGRRMGAAAVTLSLILFVQSFMFRYESFQSGVVSMCSAFVAVMPVGMYLLNHLAGFVGAAKCSRQGVKVQDKRAIMRLPETDVLCVGDSSLLGESDLAMETIAKLQDDGVRIVLISGEEPKELFERAERMGIDKDGQFIDACTLHDMEAMRKAVLRHSVIGNATPLKKGIFVNILQESGNTVAVAAKDGTDCAAVQNADVSFGFASKEERVSGLSDMYIENGCLVSFVQAYTEGRKLSGNLKHLSGLFFMKNVTALLLALYAALCSAAYPVTLSMWTLTGIFTIGIPCVFLFFYGEEKEYEERFLLKSLKTVFPTALAGAVAVVALLRYGIVFGLDAGGTATAAVFLLAFAGFLMLGRLCMPITVFDVILMVFCVTGFLVCFVFGKTWFGMERMDLHIRMMLVLFMIAEESLHRLLGFLTDMVFKK